MTSQIPIQSKSLFNRIAGAISAGAIGLAFVSLAATAALAQPAGSSAPPAPAFDPFNPTAGAPAPKLLAATTETPPPPVRVPYRPPLRSPSRP